ncbi:MAG TPA: NAD(P)/FAD-dependent oxidoreductase [Alphaproteobacteria bacterium]|nr:NAD(P)/FAD-dependent oxidoreductase [Alphaproteobacteria bacterium]
MAAGQAPILIAGAGPVGVVSALALARAGLPVEVFEAQADVDTSPRAATTHPATLEMIAELGLIDEYISRGLVARMFQFWDRPTGRKVAEFDHEVLKGDAKFPFVVQTEQHKLARMAIARLTSLGVPVHFGCRVDAVELSDMRVRLTVAGAKGAREVEGSYLIGADGGRSSVRKALGIEFTGYTFPERFLVLTTPYDFEAEQGFCFRNYIADPEAWTNLFKVAGDDGRGLWRAVFPTLPGETDEQVLNDAAVQGRMQKFFPKRGAYDIVHRNLYNVHQRVAQSFRKGRAFLAGDAAHVNNPIGGLGLNCGIHDAMELASLLVSVSRGEQPDAALDRYDRRRRPINIEFVQQQTIANKKRLEEKDPAVRQANFETLRKTAADPAAHRAFLMRTSLIESVRKAKAIA